MDTLEQYNYALSVAANKSAMGRGNWSAISNVTVAYTATWNAVSIATFVAALLGYLLDGILLYIFSTNVLLRTPFTVFIMNLLFTDLVILILQYPMDVISNLYPDSYWPMSSQACTLELYTRHVLQAATVYFRSFMATDRLTAICTPVTHARRQSFRRSIIISIVILFYVHALMLPLLIMDAMWYREPATLVGCRMNENAQRAYFDTATRLVTWVPWSLTLLAFPLTVLHERRSRRNRAPTASLPTEMVAADGAPPVAAAQPENPEQPSLDKETEKCQNYWILALLMTTALVCWVPSVVTYNSKSVFGWYTRTSVTAPQVAVIFFLFLPIMDALVFSLTYVDLRNALGRFLHIK